jgi:hypothetical protein
MIRASSTLFKRHGIYLPMLVFPSFSRHQPLISMQTPLRILGIAGSLRQQSFNLALLKAAPEYNHGIPGVPKLH